ncbi:MAG TPA: hypothetical protein VNU93_08045 [Verrucomicrobiae bacterium]|nr:hypothetical protein [Verrucomicrobiae bacterium]
MAHYKYLAPGYGVFPYPANITYPLPYQGYEPLQWERFEEQFHPPWLRQMEARMGFTPGREPLWWELMEEQFEPPGLQRMERRLGIPQPYDLRYDFPRYRIL